MKVVVNSEDDVVVPSHDGRLKPLSGMSIGEASERKSGRRGIALCLRGAKRLVALTIQGQPIRCDDSTAPAGGVGVAEG